MFSDHRQQSLKVALVLITIVQVQWLRLRADSLTIDQNFTPSQQLLPNNVSNTVDEIVHSNSLSNTSAIAASQYHQPELVKHDHRRPIWAIAHMVNSIKELNYRLSKGANAVEVDVTFGREGDPLYTYHGPPCDCWRHCHQQEDFHEYLNYVREIAIDMPNGIGQNLTLLFLDLKLGPLDLRSKARAGQELAKSVMANLFLITTPAPATINLPRNVNVDVTLAPPNELIRQPIQQQQQPPLAHFKLIISINHVGDIDLINNFIHTLEINNSSHLMEHIGFDVGMNDDLQLIESMWRKFGNTLNLWQGDGFTNCFSPFYNLERLSKALAKRDNLQGYPAKVYQWTIDLHDRMRESLALGVDAIMTNNPERLLAVLREPETAHDFRLASRNDNPFRKLTRRLVGRSSETARYQRSAHSQSGGFMGSFVDILASLLAYIKEIPFLSFPMTLVSSRSSHQQDRKTTGNIRSALQPAKTGGGSVMLVKMQNQPEYKIDNISGFVPPLVGRAASRQPASLSDTLDQSVVQPDDTTGYNVKQSNLGEDYDGPKWYVSLISNLLLSAVKIILPT